MTTTGRTLQATWIPPAQRCHKNHLPLFEGPVQLIWVFPQVGGVDSPTWMVKIRVPTLLKWIWGDFHPYFGKHPYNIQIWRFSSPIFSESFRKNVLLFLSFYGFFMYETLKKSNITCNRSRDWKTRQQRQLAKSPTKPLLRNSKYPMILIERKWWWWIFV